MFFIGGIEEGRGRRREPKWAELVRVDKGKSFNHLSRPLLTHVTDSLLMALRLSLLWKSQAVDISMNSRNGICRGRRKIYVSPVFSPPLAWDSFPDRNKHCLRGDAVQIWFL